MPELEDLLREAFEAGVDWGTHGAIGNFVETPPDFDEWFSARTT